MQQYADYASQLFDVFRQHLPSEVMATQFPAAIVAMLFGVGICVLGAKLARWFITILFASAGLVCGLSIGNAFGFSSPVAALGGGLVLGGVGFSLHRFWVGLLAGAFLSSIALTLVSSQMALPHLLDFVELEKSQHASEVQSGEVQDFQPGPGSGAIETGWQKLRGYGDRFESYLKEQQPTLQRNAVLWSVGAGLLGLLMGLFLNRLTLILFTAAFGTILISGGIFVLGNGMGMNLVQASRDRPGMTALAVLSFFVVSVALQTALTKKAAATASEK